jgi:hypothetical protein
MLPHHPIWGHLPIAGELMSKLPSDAHGDYLQLLLQANFKSYFPPSINKCPPALYVDLWPFAAPLILSMDPDVSAQFTQKTSLIKPPQQKAFLKPLTGMKDLSSWEGETWRVWRKRLNPGFGLAQITARMGELVEEMEVFVNGLRARAGQVGDGAEGGRDGWGEVFSLQDVANRLTLDIIGRIVL